MKLNKSDINELRKQVEKKLLELPEGGQIQLSVEILEELLFQKVQSKSGEVAKLPVWTGKFLQKIDLSQVSFENVILSYSFPETKKEYALIGYPPFYDFSHTNIKIDFAKIVGTTIDSCDFSGVDLSDSHIEELECIKNSNLSDTNIHLNLQNPHLQIYNSDLSKNSFQTETVQAEYFLRNGALGLLNNFSETGLSICLCGTNEAKKAVVRMIRTGMFTGCFVNGKKIKNAEEKKAIRDLKRNEYMVYKEQIMQLIDASVNKEKEKVSLSLIKE